MATPLTIEDLEGDWEIVETDVWAKDKLDIKGPAMMFIQLERNGQRGEESLRMLTIDADLDIRCSMRGKTPMFEFTWENDRRRESCRGWGLLTSEDRIEGRFFIHCGDESSLVAERSSTRQAKMRNSSC